MLADFGARIGPAVEEIVRYASPVIWMRRTLTRDASLSGLELHEGDKVLLFYQSANRDASVFAAGEPDYLCSSMINGIKRLPCEFD